MRITVSKFRILMFCMIMTWSLDCLASPPYTVHCGEMKVDIFLGMTKPAIVETLGSPDRVKSDGLCFQYDDCDISIFFSRTGFATQIYVGKKFTGTITNKDHQAMSADQLLKNCRSENEQTLYYTPSTSIQNSASVESENKLDSSAMKEPALPLEYRGAHKKYDLVAGGQLIKTKYVFDEEQIAFWLDGNQVLYATVIYLPGGKDLISQENDLKGKIKPVADSPEPAFEEWSLIYFDFDQDQVKSDYFPALNQLSSYMKNHTDQHFLIEGHADEKGTGEYNQALGYRRAMAVLNYLKRQSVSSPRLSCRSYGKSKPVAPNQTPAGKDSPEGRAKNRRVEIKHLHAE